MEIPAIVPVIHGILSSAKKMLIDRKGMKPHDGNFQEQDSRNIDVSGDANQIVNVGSNATVEVHQSQSGDGSPEPLQKGAACPHLKPEFVGPSQYKAVGFWKNAKGYALTTVQGGGLAGTSECGFNCGTLISGQVPKSVEEEISKSIEAYCVDGDPYQPGPELMNFWRSRNLLH